MSIDFFLERCEQLWPGKALTLDQRAFYGAKLMPFEGRDLARIFDYLSENSKFFPKIADVFDAARHCSMLDRVSPNMPHAWQPNGCMLCGGSGQLAVFYELLFDRAASTRELHFRRAMQYESSSPTSRTHPEWTMFYFRCSCPRGEVNTLNKGLPQWSERQPGRRGGE